MKAKFLTTLLMFSAFGFSQVREIFKDTIKPLYEKPNSFGINYAVDMFEGQTPRHLNEIRYGRKTKYGSIISSLQYANRFNKEDYGLELELYPKIRKGTYAYLGYGASFQKTLFARNRYGAEIFQSLPKKFEGSIGFRQLNFSSSKVTIYTGSVGKYYKNYWLNVRTFITPKSEGTSTTFLFLGRKYFRDAENYVSVTGGFGRGFEDVGLEEYLALKSYRIGAEWQQVVSENFYVTAQFDFRKDEAGYRPGTYINRYGFSIGTQYKF